MAIVPVLDGTFQTEVLGSDKPVLVDFWAEWCGPCKMIAPILDEVAAELGDQVKIVKLDIDKNPETPTQFGVRSIPTLILFKNGQALSIKVGLQSKSNLIDWVQSAV
jgi:thioredoxin 1